MVYRTTIGIVLAALVGSFGAMMYFVIQRDWTLSFWAGGVFGACWVLSLITTGASGQGSEYVDRWDVGREDEL